MPLLLGWTSRGARHTFVPDRDAPTVTLIAAGRRGFAVSAHTARGPHPGYHAIALGNSLTAPKCNALMYLLRYYVNGNVNGGEIPG